MKIFILFNFYLWIISNAFHTIFLWGDYIMLNPINWGFWYTTLTKSPDLERPKKNPYQCGQQNHNNHHVQIIMTYYYHHYRQYLLCGWYIHFNSHHHFQILSNFQAIVTNMIFNEAHPLPVLAPLESLLLCQIFIIIDMER